MAIPSKNVLGNQNVTEGNFQIAIEQLRESVIGSGKVHDNANTYMQYDTCVYEGITYYSKINSNTGNTPYIGANWGLIGDLFNLLITNGTALGYGTGSGGNVTQLTSKSTAVTLNKPCGEITMNNSALAGAFGSYITFRLNNNLISQRDLLFTSVISGSSTVNRYYTNSYCQDGTADITVRQDTGTTLSEAVVVAYVLIKGVNS